MSEICINLTKMTNEPAYFKGYMKEIKTQITELTFIKGKIDLGSSTGSINKSISNVSEELGRQYASLELLAEQLEAIIREYQQTEKGLVGAVPNAKDTSDSAGGEEKTDDDSYIENAIQQALMGEFYDGETNLLGDILSIIISFVPGLNCIADIRDLAADLGKALEDGKLNGNEIALLAVDVLTVVGDVISLGALVKGIKGATKATKAAKTAQKAAAREAKETAKEAAKEAAKATKKAKEAAKEAAEKGTRKTKKRAAGTAKGAKEKAETAKKAKEAAKEAKEAAQGASKEHNKNVTKEVAKDAIDKDADEITRDAIAEDYKKRARAEMKATK